MQKPSICINAFFGIFAMKTPHFSRISRDFPCLWSLIKMPSSTTSHRFAGA